MGMLIDGKWSAQEQQRTNASGEFVRNSSSFRAAIGDAAHPPVSGRYHLFVNAGCPWAYRTILYRQIKGLGEHISMSFTEPAMGHEGWTFGAPEDLLGAQHIHQIYSAARADYTGRTTVPVLWDKSAQTIVNNESSEIIRMLDQAFVGLDGVIDSDHYPQALREQIDALNEEIYANVNNGVYRCGFAQSQQAYELAYDALFTTLDDLDARLADQRFLCGATITEADWRLFATLVRFDLAYHGLFRCNRNRLSDYEHLWPYTRDLYQQPGVAQTVDVAAIKGIYYGSRKPGIIPKGPALDFDAPSGRA